jgi:ParB family chromosome partitioning protein
MSVKRGLGRGFDDLIPTDVLDEEFDPTAGQDEKISELRQIALTEIRPNSDQPRKDFDQAALAGLAESIKVHGVLQPIVITPSTHGYEIVAGERRWRAAELAGLKRIPAIIRTLGNQHKLELALIENLQRTDLSPLETATAYLKLKNQFNLSSDQVASRVGRAPSTISNMIRLLGLPDFAKQALADGRISEGHARQILALDDETVQRTLAELIIREDWSVRKAEQYVIGYKKGNQGATKTDGGQKAVRTETKFTRALSQRLGLPVSVRTTAHGGQLVIKFKNDKDLAKLEKLIG